jgi:hypothetical protein
MARFARPLADEAGDKPQQAVPEHKRQQRNGHNRSFTYAACVRSEQHKAARLQAF